MPLSIKPKESKLKKLKDRAAKITQKLVSNSLMEVALILLILANLVVNLKFILTIYIFLYFLDRWDLIGMFRKDRVTVVHKQDDKDTTK